MWSCILTVSAIQQANSPAQLHISVATCHAVGNVKVCSHLEYSALDPQAYNFHNNDDLTRVCIEFEIVWGGDSEDIMVCLGISPAHWQQVQCLIRLDFLMWSLCTHRLGNHFRMQLVCFSCRPPDSKGGAEWTVKHFATSLGRTHHYVSAITSS